MRSCLRMPLAPGRSRARAILVSSVMFFSFSSAIVIMSPMGFLGLIWEEFGDSKNRRELDGPRATRGTRQACLARRDFQERLLCSATLGFGNCFRRHRDDLFRLAGGTHAPQYVVHRVLNAGIGLVKLPRCLGHKLAQKI